jgi:amino acid transporter
MPTFAIPLLTALFIIIITLLAGKSADLVLKMQVPIIILVGLSILALIIGVFMNELQAPVWEPSFVTAPGGFWVIFAVFFPGVTGFLAGIAMSGDLKNPGVAIPRGTMYSVLTGLGVYLLIPILLSITAVLSMNEMADPEFGLKSWTTVALFGGLLIYPAAWGAIFSSAIGSVLSGPRVLQSLSMDGLAPKFLSRLSKNGQPRIATWITGGIALAAVGLGELNTVAKFVTVLFLTLYVVINLVAALEKLVAEPSYRPKIDVPWYVSMIGAIGALFVMYLISPIALLIAVGLEVSVYIYFRKKALQQQWGDVNAGFWMRIARFSLLKMNKRNISERNWRPLILVFVKDIKERIELVKLAAAFGQNKGVLTISKLVFDPGEFNDTNIKEMRRKMFLDLEDHDLEAFCEVNLVKSLHTGILNLANGHGTAGLKTNTVAFGLSNDRNSNVQQLNIIRDLAKARINILLVKFNNPESWSTRSHDSIHIWWGGMQKNGDLMLILAYMLKLNREWENAVIRIFAVVENENEQYLLETGIKHSIDKARIPATVDVKLKNNESFPSIIQRESHSANLVFLGLNKTMEDQMEKHAEKIEILSTVGDIVVFVQNNSVKDTMPVLLREIE